MLSLIALFGLIVLTVDVGQLLFQRRGMVNASDAAALAAAQSCAGLDDSDVPEAMANAFAVNNVGNAITALPNITDMVGCDSESFGHVSVEYAMNQDLFFAGVLGFERPGLRAHRGHGRMGTRRRRQPAADRGLHGERPGQLRHPGGHSARMSTATSGSTTISSTIRRSGS